MLMLNPLNEIKSILEQSSNIAIVGLSPKEARPSNKVAKYLIENNFNIFPVNPGQSTILGLKCYPDLLAVPEKIDIVNIFRRSEDVPPIVQQAVQIGASTVWMQQGVISEEGAELAKKNNMHVIMDRCIKIDHASL